GQNHGRQFRLKTGENTAFDQALRYTAGRTNHFFAADLNVDKMYRNERQDWKEFYQSAIVVPIRYVDPAKIGQADASDDIGFLAVDTKSRNSLNGGYQVELLASFADQMYNFMSLMRGKFGVSRN